jgi:hypothetical protein
MGFFKNMMSTFTHIDEEAQSLDEKIVGTIAGNFQEKRMNEAGYGTAYSIPEEFKHFPQFNGPIEYMIVKDEDGCKKCGPQLLEPVFDVEVVTPEEYTGDVIGDLNSRRGRIQDLEPRRGVQVIRAAVPLSEMFGYATVLRSATQGRASYTMQFKCYEPLPAALSVELVERFGAKANS